MGALRFCIIRPKMGSIVSATLVVDSAAIHSGSAVRYLVFSQTSFFFS